MRRVSFNILLVVLFVFLMIAIILPFLSESKINYARNLAASYRWKKANNEYVEAIKLSPFNSKHVNEYGKFLENQSSYDKKVIKKTENLYKRALELNPRCAEYAIDLGRLYVDSGQIKKAFKNFRKAIKNDPNGFNTVYQVGYAPITVWNLLSYDEKELVLDSLMIALRKRSWYGFEYIYPRLWQYTHNFKILQLITPSTLSANKSLMSFIINYDLGQFYVRQEKILDFYAKKEVPEEFNKKYLKQQKLLKQLISQNPNGSTLVTSGDWVGERQYSGNEYKNGNMYWSGTIFAVINLPKGASIIKINAKGSKARDIWPYMVVGLDGKEIGDVFVSDQEWKEYSFNINTEGGVKVLSVTFPNDGGDEVRGEDRNLYIGKAEVVKGVK